MGRLGYDEPVKNSRHVEKDLPQTILAKELAARFRLRWKAVGTLHFDAAGKLSFPEVAATPGIYRLHLSTAQGGSLYVGEAVDLRRRFGNYRNPGPTQQTSQRINDALKACLLTGGSIAIDIAAQPISLSIGKRSFSADLADKATRRMLEHAAIVAHRAHDIEDLNR
jgi:hypothetical protein